MLLKINKYGIMKSASKSGASDEPGLMNNKEVQDLIDRNTARTKVNAEEIQKLRS